MYSPSISNELYFSIYSYCIPTAGRDEAIIADLQNSRFARIPLFLYEITKDYLDYSIKDIADAYGDKNGNVKKYLNSLVKEKIGVFTDSPRKFINIDLNWKSLFQLLSAIIEIKDLTQVNYSKIFEQLLFIGCPHIEIRFFDFFDFIFLKNS